MNGNLAKNARADIELYSIQDEKFKSGKNNEVGECVGDERCGISMSSRLKELTSQRDLHPTCYRICNEMRNSTSVVLDCIL